MFLGTQGHSQPPAHVGTYVDQVKSSISLLPSASAVVSLQILCQLTLCTYVASVTTSTTLWQKLQIHTTLKILSLMCKNGLAIDMLSVYVQYQLRITVWLASP